MPFLQEPPRLANQYLDDALLRDHLASTLPARVLAAIEPELEEMGALAGGELYRLQLADRLSEPVLTRYDAWGRRVDRIELTPLWRRAEQVAVRFGLTALPYEAPHGELSRVHQMALVYLFTASTDIYSCPLAMTDGAARVLQDSGNRALAERAVPRLTARDPERFWTSGQWMTEAAGGSDVSGTETVARRASDGTWRLYGRKWFTSAVSSQMALTLARPEGAPAGSRGLALFYLEIRDAAGALRGIRIDRLKDKLGTRKVPTAELTLEGAPAEPVAGLDGGVRGIAPMLNVTRLWNAVSAVALMRRGLALAADYARRRRAFGALLAEQPLHAETLADLEAELAGAFHLTFEVVRQVGRAEAGTLEARGRRLLRVLIPIAKLLTARQAVASASEVLEAFGGAGYLEDTGLPVLLRDAQVLPIWEGTTNVLALETLRAIEAAGGPSDLEAQAARWAAELPPGLQEAARPATVSLDRGLAWLREAGARGGGALEAGARRFALGVGRALEGLLVARAAARSGGGEAGERLAGAARRLARPPLGAESVARDAAAPV